MKPVDAVQPVDAGGAPDSSETGELPSASEAPESLEPLHSNTATWHDFSTNSLLSAPTPSRPAPPSPLKLGVALAGTALLLGGAALVGWHFLGGAPVTPRTRAPSAPHLTPQTPGSHAALPTLDAAPPTPAPDAVPGAPAVPDVPAPLTTPLPTPEIAAVPDVPAPLPTPLPPPDIAAEQVAPDTGSALAAVPVDPGADPDAECDRLTNQAETLAEPGRAAALLLRATELSVRNPHPVEALARLYLRTGNTTGAVEWASKLVSLRRRRAEARVLLGDAKRAAGDAAGAEQAYQEALQIDPADRTATQRLAQ